MTAWIVMGSILLFFILLMVSPVYLSVRLGDQNKVTAGYLFIRIPLFPREPQKEKKKKEKSSVPEEPLQKKEKAKATVKETIELILDLAKASASPLFHLLRRTYLVDFDLQMEVGGEDAAEIALNTAKIQAAVGYFIELFRNLRQLKRLQRVSVTPNFLREDMEYQVRFCIMIRLGTVLYAVLAAGIRFLILKLKKDPPQETVPTEKKTVKEIKK